MTRITAKILISLLVAAIVATCVPVSTELSPLPITEISTSPVPRIEVTPDPSAATVIGTVILAQTESLVSLVGMPIRLATIFWNEDRSDGAFVLEGATSPSALIKEDGTFTFNGVTPADYVIIVGDPTGSNVIIKEPDGKARVITLEAGKIFDVGKLKVILAP